MKKELTELEIGVLKDYYKDQVFESIRQFDEDLHYKTITDVEDLIELLTGLIKEYKKYERN